MCASPLASKPEGAMKVKAQLCAAVRAVVGGTSSTDPIRSLVVRRDSSKSVPVATRKMVNYASIG